MRMKKVIAFILALVVGLSGISYSGVKIEKVEAAEIWNLVWSDEFEGTSLNTKDWNYEIGNGDWGWGNGEKQYYTNRTENVEVSEGTLKIKALKENYGGQSYTSGRITTQGKQDFMYGRIEAKIKLPSFSGSWPAFWMLGANFKSVGWPRCGEIDIMEAINAENNTHGAVHWNVESADYNGQGDNSSSSAGKLPSGYSRTEWHTYGIEWDEKRIQWYVDDKVFFTQGISAAHMSEFRQNQYIILNLAIGGKWPGYNIDNSAFPGKSVMEVDYVRVYQKQYVPDETTKLEDETNATVEIKKAKVKNATKQNTTKKVKLSLKKIKGVEGYQVAVYKTKKKAKKNKKAIAKKFVKKANVTISSKKFKNKKKLFVRARAYVLDTTGNKSYGQWSKVKKVKIKK